MLVMTTIKHFYPIDIAELRYPALKELKTLHVWNALAINMIVCEFSIDFPAIATSS